MQVTHSETSGGEEKNAHKLHDSCFRYNLQYAAAGSGRN